MQPRRLRSPVITCSCARCLGDLASSAALHVRRAGDRSATTWPLPSSRAADSNAASIASKTVYLVDVLRDGSIDEPKNPVGVHSIYLPLSPQATASARTWPAGRRRPGRSRATGTCLWRWPGRCKTAPRAAPNRAAVGLLAQAVLHVARQRLVGRVVDDPDRRKATRRAAQTSATANVSISTASAPVRWKSDRRSSGVRTTRSTVSRVPRCTPGCVAAAATPPGRSTGNSPPSGSAADRR